MHIHYLPLIECIFIFPLSYRTIDPTEHSDEHGHFCCTRGIYDHGGDRPLFIDMRKKTEARLRNLNPASIVRVDSLPHRKWKITMILFLLLVSSKSLITTYISEKRGRKCNLILRSCCFEKVIAFVYNCDILI